MLQVVQRLVQSLLMEEVLEMMSKVYGRDVPQEEAISWSMESWMNEHFPVGHALGLTAIAAPRSVCHVLCSPSLLSELQGGSHQAILVQLHWCHNGTPCCSTTHCVSSPAQRLLPGFILPDLQPVPHLSAVTWCCQQPIAPSMP